MPGVRLPGWFLHLSMVHLQWIGKCSETATSLMQSVTSFYDFNSFKAKLPD